MEEAEMLSSRLAIMTKGGLIAGQGTPAEIKKEHGKSFEIDLAFKSTESGREVDLDITNIEALVDQKEHPIKVAIFAQVSWTRDAVIALLKE